MNARGVAAPKEYAVRQKRARRPKPVPDPSLAKHEQIGFDRKGLQDHGALEFDAASPPTLANEVLDGFCKEDFVFDGENPPAEWDEAYENMKPAFRLVSRWMTDPSFRSFWRTLLHGSVRGEDEDGAATPRDRHIELDNRKRNWQNQDMDVPMCFDCINHHFRFQTISHAWAETRSQSAPDAEIFESEAEVDPFNDRFDSVTFLHEDFFRLSYTDFPKATISQQLRFLYFLAVTVAHEVAHLVWQYVWARSSYQDEFYGPLVLKWEPYFHDDSFVPRGHPHNELGIVWECFMFGGRIQPLNQSFSPFVPDGLALLPMDMVRHTYFWDPQGRIAPLETHWISDQFSEAWWQKEGKMAARARRPGRPRLARIRATVNRTIDSSIFQNNEYDRGGAAQRVIEHIVGGSPGHRIVEDIDDTWMLTGVVEQLWQQPGLHQWQNMVII